jgi:alpha-glucosidase
VLDEGFAWWRHGTIYQIYPRSFQDSNGDGVGDLAGATQRLDYLAELGVDAVWLSPFYRSPMADFGYDVSDHLAVDPLFGDLAAFDAFLAEGHGLRVIVDFIPNHTSDQHRWFQESRTSRTSARRDWYVWRDGGPGGGPPNNWRGEFGGPAWTRDPLTGQFYYHAFLPSQPDLNWRNPAASEAMLEVMRFWSERGVDGFRVDAIHHLFEAEHLADNPPNPEWRPGMPAAEQLLKAYTIDQPEAHEAVAEMRCLVDSYPGERVLIGEAYLPIDRLVAYYGADLAGFHLPFNFHLITTPWTPGALAGLVADYETALPAGGWPNWVLGNHDRSRVASRVGRAQASVAAMLLLTLRGTPTLYQGDELGMVDTPIPPACVRDPWEINVPGLGLGRDPVRTPMPWRDEAGGGFTRGEPWLPFTPDLPEINVERQREDPDSLLNLYRRLLRLRRREPALTHGDYVLCAVTPSLWAFERRFGDERLLVVLDIGGQGGELPVATGQVLVATQRGREGDQLADMLRVAPDEGLVIRSGIESR